MRLPRKLKKGCRTLNGNPRTKWQRKGWLHIAKTLENIAKTAAAAAVGMDLMRQAIERIHPITLPSGGIVIPPPLQTERMMVGESTGEIVLHRPQLDRLKHVIMADPMDGIRATIEAPNFSDIFEKISKRNQE